VMLRQGVSFVPVLSGERLLGYVDTAAARSIDREDWPARQVSEILLPEGPDTTVAPDAPLDDVFKLLSAHPRRKLMVAQGGRLVGVISLSDLMHHLALEQEIGTALKPDG